MLNETMPGGDENVLHKLLELTAEASRWQARAEERAAAHQETRSQEVLTTERFTTAMYSDSTEIRSGTAHRNDSECYQED